jgi:hypothetical protein
MDFRIGDEVGSVTPSRPSASARSAVLVLLSLLASMVVAGLPSLAAARSASVAGSCGTVSVGGRQYLVETNGGFSCGKAQTFVRKLAAEKPTGNASGLSTAKLNGGPPGFSCRVSGSPQRIGRCFKGASGFTWILAA